MIVVIFWGGGGGRRKARSKNRRRPHQCTKYCSSLVPSLLFVRNTTTTPSVDRLTPRPFPGRSHGRSHVPQDGCLLLLPPTTPNGVILLTCALLPFTTTVPYYHSHLQPAHSRRALGPPTIRAHACVRAAPASASAPPRPRPAVPAPSAAAALPSPPGALPSRAGCAGRLRSRPSLRRRPVGGAPLRRRPSRRAACCR